MSQNHHHYDPTEDTNPNPDLLRRVDRLLNDGQSSGYPLLDDLAMTVPKARTEFEAELSNRLAEKLAERAQRSTPSMNFQANGALPKPRRTTYPDQMPSPTRFRRVVIPITLVAAMTMAVLTLTVLSMMRGGSFDLGALFAAQTTPTPTPEALCFVVTTNSNGARVRALPTTSSTQLMLITQGVAVDVIGQLVGEDGHLWYHIAMNNQNGRLEGWLREDSVSQRPDSVCPPLPPTPVESMTGPTAIPESEWQTRTAEAQFALIETSTAMIRQASTVGAGIFTITPTPEPMISLIVAVNNLSRGQIITENDVAVRAWQERNAPMNGIPGSSVSSVVGKIVRADIYRGQPIIQTAITDSMENIAQVLDVESPGIDKIVVALQMIPAGMVIAADFVAEYDWPVAALPPGAFNDADDVIGRVALTDIYREMPLIETQLYRGEFAVHTVGEGESPATIAMQYGVNLDDLLSINNLTTEQDITEIQIDQNLIVPVPSATPTEFRPTFGPTLTPTPTPSSTVAQTPTLKRLGMILPEGKRAVAYPVPLLSSLQYVTLRPGDVVTLAGDNEIIVQDALILHIGDYPLEETLPGDPAVVTAIPTTVADIITFAVSPQEAVTLTAYINSRQMLTVVLESQAGVIVGGASPTPLPTPTVSIDPESMLEEGERFASIPVDVLTNDISRLKVGDVVDVYGTMLFVDLEDGEFQRIVPVSPLSTQTATSSETPVPTPLPILTHQRIVTDGRILYLDENGVTLAIHYESSVIIQYLVDAKMLLTIVPLRLSTLASTLVPIEGGTFDMGTTPGELAAAVQQCIDTGGLCTEAMGEDSLPIVSVSLNNFALETTEVTVEQYVAFLNYLHDLGKGHRTGCGDILTGVQPCVQTSTENSNSPIRTTTGGYRVANDRLKDQPVSHVTWYGAEAYCRALGRRLPTEAEWERAARGVNNTVYPWGNEWNPELANTRDSSTIMPFSVHEFGQGATSTGLLNMAGNVAEWVADWYLPDYYSRTDDLENPHGPAAGLVKVIRGGSWSDRAFFARSVHRMSAVPNEGHSYIGFRCAVATP